MQGLLLLATICRIVSHAHFHLVVYMASFRRSHLYNFWKRLVDPQVKDAVRASAAIVPPMFQIAAFFHPPLEILALQELHPLLAGLQMARLLVHQAHQVLEILDAANNCASRWRVREDSRREVRLRENFLAMNDVTNVDVRNALL